MKFNILHTEWSNGWGGQEIRIFHDIKVLMDMGHRVTLMAVPDGQMAERCREAGMRVIKQPMRHNMDLFTVIKMAGILKKEKFDVVNTHSSVDSWLASPAAKLAGTPVLVRTRHLSVPVNYHFFNMVWKWPDAFVTTAEMIRERMVNVNGMDGDRIVSIPTGIDLTVFNPEVDPGNLRSELGLKPEHKVLTMVAVLRSWKRHDIFLEAAALLVKERPEVMVLVVGEGPVRTKVEDKIKELGIEDRVIMTGHRTDVPRFLAISDLCALTSESSEGVPQSVLQYQAMGKPVVAASSGGIPEVVEDGVTGLLCPPNDVKAVAGAMARILDDENLASSLGRNGLKQVRSEHSIQVMAEKTLNLYERLYNEKKRN